MPWGTVGHLSKAVLEFIKAFDLCWEILGEHLRRQGFVLDWMLLENECNLMTW